MTTKEMLQLAKQSSRQFGNAGTETKNHALVKMAEALRQAADRILAENKKDMEEARGRVSAVMLDRLMLNQERIEAMASGIYEVAELEDPVGRQLETSLRPNGLRISKISVPMGVIAVIYESRPNVTSDAAALAIKSGSACVLRCGRQAHRSAAAITEALQCGLERAGLSRDLIMLVEDTTREGAKELMRAEGYVDLLIPRGGAGLIRTCIENATVPCIETGTGICHIYVDREADLEKALSIVNNAKTSRPSVCNAAEVCLVHREIADRFLPMLEKMLVSDRRAAGKPPVELRAEPAAQKYLTKYTQAGPADFDTEFLDYILAVKIVDSVQEAVAHILQHSTGHSEAIISEEKEAVDYFTRSVDSAAVYVNASTRFTDGGEFGLGCEMGISTQKLHARGPMGLRELTSYKYVITGNGTIR